MIKMKEVVKTTNENGEEIVLAVKRPDRHILDKSDRIYNQCFMNALKSDAPLRKELASIIEARGLWDQDKKDQLATLEKQIAESELKLAKGAAAGTKLELRKVAINLRMLRFQRENLVSQFSALENMACEIQAENKRFDFLVSECVVLNDTGDRYFLSFDDYLDRRNEKAAYECAYALMLLMYNQNRDERKNLPENKFLLKYGFCNEELHLVDKDGKPCDEDFNLVDVETGFKLNDKGELVNSEGIVVNKDGSPKVVFEEFED